MTELTRDEFVSLLGEALHTAFRKAIDTPTAVQIWHRIDTMPSKDWTTLIEWVVDSMVPLTVIVNECTHEHMGPWRNCNFGKDEVRICLTSADCDHVEKRV